MSRLFSLAASSILLTVSAFTQSPPADPQQPEGPIHTLRVFMDLIQVPVLVLDSDHERMKPIAADKFFVSLDSGTAFHPRLVRQEGEDPITLGILLDANAVPSLMEPAAAAISNLAPGSLHPADHVSLYVMDCSLMRSLDDVPADPAMLKTGVDHAIGPWLQRRKEKRAEPCDKRVHLWDSMAFIVNQLAKSPGRRVLLVVSSGSDAASRIRGDELRVLAQQQGVAVFGYTPIAGLSSSMQNFGGSTLRNARATGQLNSTQSGSLDSFDLICELSGGMRIKVDTSYVARHLTKFVTIVRERYILEFNRPRNDPGGLHSMIVTIPRVDSRVYIRPAGVSMNARDPDQDKDPNVIQRDNTNDPELGKRKPIR